jgi:phospholipid transport system substrate-binding protein
MSLGKNSSVILEASMKAIANLQTRSILVARLFVIVALAVFVSAQADEPVMQKPDEVISSVAKQVLQELDKHRDEIRRDPKKIRVLLDTYMLPHFDTEYAARLVLAKHWRSATAEQRSRFIEAFYQSLLQSYGDAMLDFTPDRLSVQPYRGNAEDKLATVKTDVRRDNGSRVPVNFTLHLTDEGWKAFDVTIEGISYIKSFQTDFTTEIDQKGLEAVIQRLESQVASGKSTKPSKPS